MPLKQQRWCWQKALQSLNPIQRGHALLRAGFLQQFRVEAVQRDPLPREQFLCQSRIGVGHHEVPDDALAGGVREAVRVLRRDAPAELRLLLKAAVVAMTQRQAGVAPGRRLERALGA